MMAAFRDAPCEPWPVIWCGDISEADPVVTGYAVDAATSVLWKRSGRRYGLCEMTFRPCREACNDTAWWNVGIAWGTWPQPLLYRGQWFNLTCGWCEGNCQCERLEQFKLPGPIAEIVEIKIDGEVVPTGSYRVDDWRYVVRTDGGEWPRCNNLNKNDTEAGTWSVTAQLGEEVPAEARFAVGELAEQFIAACTGGDCVLPQQLQSLAAQGVNMEFVNVEELMGNGRIGLRFCDLFLGTNNPNNIQARATVWFVDGRMPRQPNT